MSAGGYVGWYAEGGFIPTPPAVEHPSRLTVYRSDWDEASVWVDGPWHWHVWHYRDRSGVRAHVVTRWGACNAWADALAGGLAALANQYQEEQS